jgi:dsRNA-specific ribonuclease
VTLAVESTVVCFVSPKAARDPPTYTDRGATEEQQFHATVAVCLNTPNAVSVVGKGAGLGKKIAKANAARGAIRLLMIRESGMR